MLTLRRWSLTPKRRSHGEQPLPVGERASERAQVSIVQRKELQAMDALLVQVVHHHAREADGFRTPLAHAISVPKRWIVETSRAPVPPLGELSRRLVLGGLQLRQPIRNPGSYLPGVIRRLDGLGSGARTNEPWLRLRGAQRPAHKIGRLRALQRTAQLSQLERHIVVMIVVVPENRWVTVRWCRKIRFNLKKALHEKCGLPAVIQMNSGKKHGKAIQPLVCAAPLASAGCCETYGSKMLVSKILYSKKAGRRRAPGGQSNGLQIEPSWAAEYCHRG